MGLCGVTFCNMGLDGHREEGACGRGAGEAGVT